jgi:hypothetical protein
MKSFATMASLAALAAGAGPSLCLATTPVAINGGGAASQLFDYAAPDVNGVPVSEEFLFNSLQSKSAFGEYWYTTSKNAQAAMVNNDLTCLENGQTGNNGGACSNTPGGADAVHYAISETALSSSSIGIWSTSSWGQSAAGNLIQLPAMGTGLAIVVNDTNIAKNGGLQLSDSDLCEIFSGGYTDFSQITDSAHKPAAGAITLVYRADSAGNTFSLTNHLAAVCTARNTAAGVTFTATSSFSTLFSAIATQLPGGLPVANLASMANTLAGLQVGPLPQAIGYISPDWTSIDSATSSAKLSNGEPSPLIVAALLNNGRAWLPTAPEITTGLNHVSKANLINPPSTATQGANPALWVPVIQTVSTGYPIVTYTTIELAQCYANATLEAGVLAFLKDHYNVAAFKKIQKNNGLVSVVNSGAANFLSTIRDNILANTNGWNTDIGDVAACNGKVGR